MLFDPEAIQKTLKDAAPIIHDAIEINVPKSNSVEAWITPFLVDFVDKNQNHDWNKC